MISSARSGKIVLEEVPTEDLFQIGDCQNRDEQKHQTEDDGVIPVVVCGKPIVDEIADAEDGGVGHGCKASHSECKFKECLLKSHLPTDTQVENESADAEEDAHGEVGEEEYKRCDIDHLIEWRRGRDVGISCLLTLPKDVGTGGIAQREE